MGLHGIELAQPISNVLAFFISIPFSYAFMKKMPRTDLEDISQN